MESEKKSNGALVGLVIIIIILIVGGIYMWEKSKSKRVMENPIGANTEALSSQDAASLDALNQDIQKTDANTGVDANAVN